MSPDGDSALPVHRVAKEPIGKGRVAAWWDLRCLAGGSVPKPLTPLPPLNTILRQLCFSIGTLAQGIPLQISQFSVFKLSLLRFKDSCASDWVWDLGFEELPWWLGRRCNTRFTPKRCCRGVEIGRTKERGGQTRRTRRHDVIRWGTISLLSTKRHARHSAEDQYSDLGLMSKPTKIVLMHVYQPTG